MSTVAGSPSAIGCVGYQRSATSSTPSGILAARPRSTDTAVVLGGGSLTMDAAIRLHTVMRNPPLPALGGVEQPEHDRVVERLPAGLDDVLRDPDRGPRALPVSAVHQDACDGASAPPGIED